MTGMDRQKLHCSTYRIPSCMGHVLKTRRFILLAFFRIILWSSFSSYEVAAADDTQNSGSKVVYLTDPTFQDYNEGFLLVLYYADWSGPCRKLLPLWSQLAKELDSAGSSVTVGLIDSQGYRQNPGSRYVHTLPTLFLFHDGEIVADFPKEATLEGIKSVLERFIDLSSAELARNKKLAAQQLEEAKVERTKKLEDANVEEELMALKFESDVPTLSKDSFLLDTYNKDALVMVYTKWCELCKAFKPDWLALANDPQIPGLLVAKINSDSFNTFPGARLVTSVPTIFFMRNSVVHGKYNGSWTLEDVRGWALNMTRLSAEDVQDALADIHAQELKTERDARKSFAEVNKLTPAVDEEFQEIKMLTNENFAEETRGRSALILFYTENGQRSQLMKPVWVALRNKDLGGILLARFPEQDARWNQEMEFIHGYPTVLVARKGVIIERYEGVRKLDQLHHYAQSLLSLSDEDAYDKGVQLARTIEMERLAEAEKERLLVKAEEKRREEELRKAKQLKRKHRTRHGGQ